MVSINIYLFISNYFFIYFSSVEGDDDEVVEFDRVSLVKHEEKNITVITKPAWCDNDDTVENMFQDIVERIEYVPEDYIHRDNSETIIIDDIVDDAGNLYLVRIEIIIWYTVPEYDEGD